MEDVVPVGIPVASVGRLVDVVPWEAQRLDLDGASVPWLLPTERR